MNRPGHEHCEAVIASLETALADCPTHEDLDAAVFEVNRLSAALAEAQPHPADCRCPREPDNDLVICPCCTHQFPAIPVNVQKRLAEAQRKISDMEMEYVALTDERDALRARLAKCVEALNTLIDACWSVVGKERDGAWTFQPGYKYAPDFVVDIQKAQAALDAQEGRTP